MYSRESGAAPNRPNTISKSLAGILNIVLVAALTISMAFLPLGGIAFAAQQASSKTSTTDTSASDDDQPAQDPVAKVGSETFTTLETAISAAESGDTIELLKDVDMTNKGVVDISNKTLDLDGHKISAKNSTFFILGSDSTIKNGSFDSMKGSYGLFFGDNPTSVNAVLEDLDITGGINLFNVKNVVIKNVNVDVTSIGKSAQYYAVWCDINASCEIDSGTFKSDGPAILGIDGNTDDGASSSIDIKGGDFYTNDGSPLALSGGNYVAPVITGGTFPDGADVAQYIDKDASTVTGDDGRYAVREKSGNVTHDDGADSLDPQLELVEIKPTAKEDSELAEAASLPDMSAELSKAGGMESSWNVNVVLRDKDTMVENHDTETTFVIDYPDDVDTSKIDKYVFKVMHLKTVEKDGASSSVPEIIDDSKVNAKTDGLHITSTLSPFTVSYALREDKPVQTGTGSNATTPGTNDNSSSSSSASHHSANHKPVAATNHSNKASSTSAGAHKANKTSSTSVPAADASTAASRSGNQTKMPMLVSERLHVGIDYIEEPEVVIVTEQTSSLGMILTMFAIVALAAGTAGLIAVRRGEERAWNKSHPLPRQ